VPVDTGCDAVSALPSGIVIDVGEPGLTIVDRPEGQRYEALLDGEMAGFLEYRLAGTRRILLHTEVPPAFEGRGIGAAMARHVVDEARALGSRVTAKCPFIRAWLARHPEYTDVITPDPAIGDG
jgi:predicted GNAT family acetyltransferase